MRRPKRLMPARGHRQLAAGAVFAVSMGYLESAVVFYLRRLYCPDGFGFPLRNFMDPHALAIEGLREMSTLVMLLAVAYLSAVSWKDRFAFFLFTFAVWDIFYYVWLKVLLGWPGSFQTFDVLFLIPWPWVGPVLAPVTASFTMILLALALLKSKDNPRPPEWALWIAGSFAILVTFLGDFGRLIVEGGHLPGFFQLAADPRFREISSNHVPGGYDWLLFIAGEAVILAGVFRFYRRGRGKTDRSRK